MFSGEKPDNEEHVIPRWLQTRYDLWTETIFIPNATKLQYRYVKVPVRSSDKAYRNGFSVLYKRTSRLFADLAQARGEGRLARLIAALERVNLLILDDWGPEPLTADQRRDLLEIVDDRYDKGSLLITSQVPVPQWHDVIADPTLGDAILDRIIRNAHRIELKGDSLRRQAGEKKKP